MRVALLTNILTPYRLPVYADLAATPGWTLRVMLSAASEPAWGREFEGAFERGTRELDVETVAGLSFSRGGTRPGRADIGPLSMHLPLGLFSALRRFRPDVIVSGELGPRSLLAAAHAALFGVPLVLWSYHARCVAAAAPAWQRALRRGLLRRADAVVGMGRQARDVLRELGVPEPRLFDAPNACDQPGLLRALAALDPLAERAALRAHLGTRENVALALGRLVEVKGVVPLLDAWRALPAAQRAGWTLLFVGDGPLRAAVDAAAHAAPPGEIAHLPAVPSAETARFYAASDLFVLPSLGDAWGLTANEAMASGLPVLCSTRAGCADDLVQPGENGWTFDPLDAQGFRAALAEALAAPDLERLGANARDAAKRFGPEAMAAGIRRAVQHAAR